MPSSYPGALDAWADKTASQTLAAAGHTAAHNDVADAVEKIEVKVGTGASAASSATDGQVLTANGSGGTAWESATSAHAAQVLPQIVPMFSRHTQALTTGAVAVSDGWYAPAAGEFSVPTGYVLQFRLALIWSNATAGDVLRARLYDYVSLSYKIAQFDVTYLDTNPIISRSPWTTHPLTRMAALPEVWNTTAARGTIRAGWIEHQIVAI